jgi:hypothetical protein
LTKDELKTRYPAVYSGFASAGPQRSETRVSAFIEKISPALRRMLIDLMALGAIGILAFNFIGESFKAAERASMERVAASQINAPTDVPGVKWINNLSRPVFEEAFNALMTRRAERAIESPHVLPSLTLSGLEKMLSKLSTSGEKIGIHENGFLLEYAPGLIKVWDLDEKNSKPKYFYLPNGSSRLKAYLERTSLRSEVRLGGVKSFDGRFVGQYRLCAGNISWYSDPGERSNEPCSGKRLQQ